jgi:hypothetical protein
MTRKPPMTEAERNKVDDEMFFDSMTPGSDFYRPDALLVLMRNEALAAGKRRSVRPA